MSLKILIVTGCGVSKHSEPMEAYKLYKSSRIKAVYNRKQGCDMCILSAKYGLVDAEKVIGPYEKVMDEKRASELMPSILEKISKYDYVILFKGGTKQIYQKCIENACKIAEKPLIQFGYAHMGEINKLTSIIESL